MRYLRLCVIVAAVLAVAALVPHSPAVAQITIDYYGETPVGSGSLNDDITEEGIEGYGAGDDELWDYRYRLSASSDQDGPVVWAIAVPIAPDNIGTPFGWDGGWDGNITAEAYGGAFDDTDLEDRAGVVWRWTGTAIPGNTAPTLGVFHIQTIQAPVMNDWQTYGLHTDYTQSGSEWSPTPEPASIALTSLALLGVGWWRRKKKRD